MGICTIIGKISVPASVGQAILINGKPCTEETTWNVSAFGGESVVTAFTLDNRANVGFSIDFAMSTATDSEYTAGVYETDGVTPVSSPTVVAATTLYNWKFKVDFDKYITTDTYNIEIIFDFV